MEFSKRLSNPESITELDIFNATAKELSILIGLQDVKTTCKYEVLALAKRRHHYLTEKPENLTVEDIQDLGLPEIKEFVNNPDRIRALNEEAFNQIQHKFTTLGITPAESDGWIVFSKTNLRYRSTVNIVTTAMIGYIFRALEERKREDAHMHFKCPLNNEQESRIVENFLNDLFVYDPHRSIDRYSAGLFSKTADEFIRKSEHSKEKTLFEELPPPLQRMHIKRMHGIQKIDSEVEISYEQTEARKVGKNIKNKYETRPKRKGKMKVVDYTNPGKEILLQDTNIDPPMDLFAGFYNYMTINWDAIHTLSTNLYWYNRPAGEDDPNMQQYETTREDVKMYAIPKPTPEDPNPKEKLLYSSSFMGPESQLEDMIYVHSEIANTKEMAEDIRDKMSRKFASLPWMVGRAASTILTADWRANRRNMKFDDAHLNAILQQHEEDLMLGRKMNAERVKRAKMMNILESGPDSEEIMRYMKELKGEDFNTQELTTEDFDRIMPEIRRRLAESKIHDMDNPSFAGYVQSIAFPNRNFEKDPLTYPERKVLSKKYNEEYDPPEMGQDQESMILDTFHQHADGMSKYRDYMSAFDTDMTPKK